MNCCSPSSSISPSSFPSIYYYDYLYSSYTSCWIRVSINLKSVPLVYWLSCYLISILFSFIGFWEVSLGKESELITGMMFLILFAEFWLALVCWGANKLSFFIYVFIVSWLLSLAFGLVLRRMILGWLESFLPVIIKSNYINIQLNNS